MATLGKTIKGQRKALGLSLRKVCVKVSGKQNKSISVSYLNDIEQGHRKKPSGEILVKIAKALDLDKDLLLRLADRVDPELIHKLKNPTIVKKFREMLKLK